MNLFAPERQPNESFAVYQERRKTAHQIAKNMRRAPKGDFRLTVEQHHATEKRKTRRYLVRLMGRRQYKKVFHASVAQEVM